MKTDQKYSVIDKSQLTTINGGGFAYDFGRVLRFIGIANSPYVGAVSVAIFDWEVNKIINEVSRE